jgi:glycosyltransferase involved in cell wall biosynthesis
MFKLCKYNWVSSSYPTKKIEWIIVDDSDNESDLIPLNLSEIPEQLPENFEKMNIKYIKLDSKQSIGNKRNIGIQNASNDILVMMDDDDYYKSDSFKTRVCHLLSENNRNSEIKCIASTRIGCFEINKLISFMNVPPYELPLSERTSEASYCFYKSFWEERKFEDTNRGEGVAFLKGRENNMFELECEYVLVSLLHKNNSCGKKLPTTEANGCHYGWSDKLFTFITNLDKDN